MTILRIYCQNQYCRRYLLKTSTDLIVTYLAIRCHQCERVSIFLKKDDKLFSTCILTARALEKISKSSMAYLQMNNNDNQMEELNHEVTEEDIKNLRKILKEI